MTEGVTAAWVNAQRVKASCPVIEGWRDGVLTVWLAGTPKNPLNGSHEHWSKRARWARGWRESASTRLLAHRLLIVRRGAFVVDTRHPWPWKGADPKVITFTVYGPSRFDDDNLTAVVKPVRDSLKDMAVIDDDRPSSGHVFRYEQAKPSRKPGSVYGIALAVRLA